MSDIQNLPLRRSLAIFLLSSTMIYGGCKSKKEDIGTVPDVNILISQPDFGDIGDVLKVSPKKVDASESMAALKAAGLWNKTELLTWGSRSEENGTYSFTNIVVADVDGAQIKAKRLNIVGLHMKDDVPNAQLITFSDIDVEHDDIRFSIDDIGMTNMAIGNGFEDIDSFQPFDVDTAFVISGLSGANEEVDINIDRLGWGQDPKDGHLRFAAQDLSINAHEQSDITIKLERANLRSLDALNTAQIEKISAAMQRNDVGAILAENQQLGNASIDNFSITTDSLSMTMPTWLQTAKKAGDVTTLNYKVPSLTLQMKEVQNMPRDYRKALETFNSLGFDEMDFSSQGQTEINKAVDLMTIKSASINLKDGFNLNYAGAISGLDALRELSAQDNVSRADIRGQQNAVKLHDFEMSLEDNSIVERGFNLASEVNGQSAVDLRRQANGFLALGSLAALTQKDGKIYSEFAKSLGEFIKDGGTIQLSLKPEEPISLKEFERLASGKRPDLKRLGFSSSRRK